MRSVNKPKNKINAVSPLLKNMMVNVGIEDESTDRQKWCKLDELYQDIGTALVTIGYQINEAVTRIQDIVVPNIADVTNNVKTIRNDLESFTTKLLMVKAKHADKKGEVSDDDYGLCIECFNDYVLINDEFRALIFPPMLTITEALMSINVQEETNVNAITDIQVKEIVQ